MCVKKVHVCVNMNMLCMCLCVDVVAMLRRGSHTPSCWVGGLPIFPLSSESVLSSSMLMYSDPCTLQDPGGVYCVLCGKHFDDWCN